MPVALDALRRPPVTDMLTDYSSRSQWYGHTHNEVPSLKSIARLVQTMLYGKRFFPYYSYVIRTRSLSLPILLRRARS